jgi:chlorite dismutase
LSVVGFDLEGVVDEIREERLDIRERGAGGQASDRRLFVQLQVFTGCLDSAPLAEALAASGLEAVLYLDVNDPRGVGVLGLTEAPEEFTTRFRSLYNAPPFAGLTHRPEFTMLGRTYALGHEADLTDWLLRHPRRTVANPACPWAVWYPLRRTGAFARLSPKEQGAILREHGMIGRTYGEAGLGHDVRLACNGLDAADNDFVIGLIGPDLFPLSHLVQAMRKTIQTSEYLEKLGPFFIGRACWQRTA